MERHDVILPPPPSDCYDDEPPTQRMPVRVLVNLLEMEEDDHGQA